MMRTLLAGSSSVSMTPLRALNGTCVDVQIVTWSPDHWATMARGSIGVACEPSATKRLLITRSASFMPCSTSPLTIVEWEASLPSRTMPSVSPYEAQSTCTSGAPGASACLEVVDDRQLLVVDLDEVDGRLRRSRA